jgi:hypothetical protein
MKVRDGFVSNSSSSSFIIALDKVPKSVEDVKSTFFPRREYIKADYYDEVLTADEAAAKIWNQLKDEKPLTKTKILEEILSGYFDGYPERQWGGRPSNDFQKEFREKNGKCIQECDKSHKEEYEKWSKMLRKERDEDDKQVKQAGKEYLKFNEPMFKSRKVFVVNFGDSHGTEVCGVMEHGNAFQNVQHLRISHH